MSEVKNLIVKSIDAASAKKIVSRFHYSGKTTQNSQLHFGVFLNGKLEGAMQFGPSIDKRRMAQNLGVGFNEVLELNRMAFSDLLPRNSESRALSVALKIIKKTYQHIKIIVSFADACQCGDGAIYRASGFKLHSYKKNNSLLKLPTGEIISDKALNNKTDSSGKRGSSIAKKNGAKPIPGFQMKYLFFLDKTLEKKFICVQFKDIPEEVKMYRGKKRVTSIGTDVPEVHSGEGGVSPTVTLQTKKEVCDGQA